MVAFIDTLERGTSATAYKRDVRPRVSPPHAEDCRDCRGNFQMRCKTHGDEGEVKD